MMVQLGISLKNNEVPNIFNRAILYVKTPSMEDTIMTGDLIFINVKDREFYDEDIVSFRRVDKPEIIITHRIVKIDGDLVTTKGDNNLSSESWEVNFPKENIIGSYVGKSSALGSLYEVLFLNSLNVLFGLITVVFLLIGVIEMRNIIKLLSQKRAAEIEAEKQQMIEEYKEKIKSEKEQK